MRHTLLVIICLVITACGSDKDGPQGSVAAMCSLHQIQPVTVTYPDGQARKSSVYACSNGCGEFRFVNDESIRFNTCDYPAHIIDP